MHAPTMDCFSGIEGWDELAGLSVEAEVTLEVEASPDLGSWMRLVSLYHENECLIRELDAVQRRLTQARDLARESAAKPVLADALITRLRARHSAILTLLRSNRCVARDLIAEYEPDPS